MIKPPKAANAALYDKTQKSGNLKSFIANIMEHLTSYKGAKGGRPPSTLPGPGRRQAAKVAGGK
jgi:hypothetical protein